MGVEKSEELKERAKKALDKLPTFGGDVDVSGYVERLRDVKEAEPESELGFDAAAYRDALLSVGVDPEARERSGTFIQCDHAVVLAQAAQEGLEVMSSVEALEKYEWLKDYWWQAVPVDMDKFTALAEIEQTHGYFIRAKPGAKVVMPVQSCLLITKDIAQNVHNIIIAEEGSELHIITGCVAAHSAGALHVGVSEFYVKKDAKITFTMVHNWTSGVEVRPRTGIVVEENGTFISNYICMSPVKNLQTYPTAYCVGENATVTFQSILYAKGVSKMDVGSRAVLAAEGAKAEIISRAAATDKASIVARGDLRGETHGVKGHLECRGLLLSDDASIASIPELNAKAHDVELSHEAAVGKIAEEEIRYLMARGLSEEEATSLIIRGFLSLDIRGLPPALADATKRMIDLIAERAL